MAVLHVDAWAHGCGVSRVGGISYITKENKPFDLVKEVLSKNAFVTFYVFCEARMPPKKGERTPAMNFFSYIKKEKLGRVTQTPGWPININHGPRHLKMYIWEVNEKNVNAWKKAHIKGLHAY